MRYLVIIFALILLIFCGISDKIIYAKSGIDHWFPFILIIFGVPFLLYRALRDFKIRQDLVLAISIGSILIIGPSYGMWTEYLSQKDLDRNGKFQKGTVIQKWYAIKRKNIDGEWLYKAEFRVRNDIFYTFSEVDEDNSIKIGDTVLIKYSVLNPENNIILNVKK